MQGVVNCRIGAAITYHEILHCYWAGRGNGTTYLESKLHQQLMAMREEVLYKIFMGLSNAYDTLDRELCLEIMVTY